MNHLLGGRERQRKRDRQTDGERGREAERERERELWPMQKGSPPALAAAPPSAWDLKVFCVSREIHPYAHRRMFF